MVIIFKKRIYLKCADAMYAFINAFIKAEIGYKKKLRHETFKA